MTGLIIVIFSFWYKYYRTENLEKVNDVLLFSLVSGLFTLDDFNFSPDRLTSESLIAKTYSLENYTLVGRDESNISPLQLH